MTTYIVDGSGSMSQCTEELKQALEEQQVESFFLAKLGGELEIVRTKNFDQCTFDSGSPLNTIEQFILTTDANPSDITLFTDDVTGWDLVGEGSPTRDIITVDVTNKERLLIEAEKALNQALSERKQGKDLAAIGAKHLWEIKHIATPLARELQARLIAECFRVTPYAAEAMVASAHTEPPTRDDNHAGETMHDDEFPDEHSHWPEEPYNSSFHVTDDEGRHYLLSINLTQEGMILDLYDRYGEENLASWAREWDEVGEMVYEQDPSNIDPQGKNPLFDEILEVLVARGAVTREQASILARDQHVIDDLWESKIGPALDRLQEQIFNLLRGKA